MNSPCVPLPCAGPVSGRLARTSPGRFFFTLAVTRISEPAASDACRRGFRPFGDVLSSNTPEKPLIRSLGSEAFGEAHGLPTPVSFAGLENREVVIAKPCTFSINGSCVVQAAHQRHRRVFACVNPGQGSILKKFAHRLMAEVVAMYQSQTSKKA